VGFCTDEKTTEMHPMEIEVTQPEEKISYEYAFIKMILILAALLASIFLSIWLFKRFARMRISNMNPLRNIKILERRPLSPKTMLYLIQISGKHVVISESQLEVRMITSLQDTDIDSK
jgi:flagellar protein FliO/FliZ